MGEPGGQNQPQPPMPDMKGMWGMLITMLLIMGLYWIDGTTGGADGAHNIGKLLNYVFCIFDFGGQYPVVTLMLMGAIMILLSSGLRTLLTDTLAQQRAQAISSAFQKELRAARAENNMFKMKKLQEMQPQMMAASMESSQKMMKSMPLTMIIVVPIFLWIRYFVDVTLSIAGNQIISVPWSLLPIGVNLTQSYVLPSWILIYSLISIPIGQIIMRLVRAYQFKKRLKELEAEETGVELA